MTPVMYASKRGFAKLVKFLCIENADLNKQETRGWTVGIIVILLHLIEFK